MMDQPTDEHCEVCGEEKKPRKLEFEIEKNPPSTVDRVRGFVSDTLGSDIDPSESEIVHKEKIFYLCPDLSCDGREGDVRKIERWRMKTDPSREFSEEKLDEIVAETVEQEKNDHQIISEAVDDVHSRMIDNSTDDSPGDDTGSNS